MKKGCLIFGLFVLLSGCSGLPVAQTLPEAIQAYGAECVGSGGIKKKPSLTQIASRNHGKWLKKKNVPDSKEKKCFS